MNVTKGFPMTLIEPLVVEFGSWKIGRWRLGFTRHHSTQAYREVPSPIADRFGVLPLWGFRVQDDFVWVYANLRPDHAGESPTRLGIGMISPEPTLAARFQFDIERSLAMAWIEVEGINLEEVGGRLIFFVEDLGPS
jgi:hypothetical protein